MPGPKTDTRWLVLQLAMELEFQHEADPGGEPAPNKRKIAATVGVDRRRVQVILAERDQTNPLHASAREAKPCA